MEILLRSYLNEPLINIEGDLHVYQGINLVVHKACHTIEGKFQLGKLYEVSELLTGLVVTSQKFKTKKEALESARTKIEVNGGSEKVLKIINTRLVSCGMI